MAALSHHLKTNKNSSMKSSISYLVVLVLFYCSQPLVIAADHNHTPSEAESHSHENEHEHKHKEAKASTFLEHNHGDIQQNEHQYLEHNDQVEEHRGKDNHVGHNDHEEAELTFSNAELNEFSIQLAQTKPGVINKTLDLTGEVIIAPERLYHVVPRVPGVVRQVFKHLGDKVKTGDLLATLSSYSLADAKAQLVSANSLLQLANTNLKREWGLYKTNVTSKRKYLAAKQNQAEMSIKHKAAQQRLLAIGLSEQSIATILNDADKDLTLYELRSPADGIIIEQHAALGEVLENNVRSFTVADLTKVWVNLTVYQKDLPLIQQGQDVTISTRFGVSNKQASVHSNIRWLSPALEERTRSATARVVIDNTTGQWRPGLFVSAKVSIENSPAAIVIPRSALQTIEGKKMVFVRHAEGKFEPQVVQLGRQDHLQVEILDGLKIGQTYVSQNAFSLKAQMQKNEFGHGHSH